MGNVLVICEIKDGRLKKVSREVLSIGRKLAADAGGELQAFVAGDDAKQVAEEAGRYGAKKLFVASGPAYEPYSTEMWTAALNAAIDSTSPSIVLFGADADGKDLAPRIAARRNVGVASEVTSLEWAGGKLVAQRPIYSGKVIGTVEVEGDPAMATCRPNAFPAEESGGGAAEVVELAAPAVEPRARVVEVRAPEAGELSIAEADIIVSGGRGLKEADNFSYIRDLAHALGGAVGASRATVDAGWIDHQHQVGQTGRVVSPNLYLAIGISGAIQHLAGMTSSKHIIAINKDAEAPIFRVADLGVVGDLFEIVPKLTEEVKKAKAQG